MFKASTEFCMYTKLNGSVEVLTYSIQLAIESLLWFSSTNLDVGMLHSSTYNKHLWVRCACHHDVGWLQCKWLECRRQSQSLQSSVPWSLNWASRSSKVASKSDGHCYRNGEYYWTVVPRYLCMHITQVQRYRCVKSNDKMIEASLKAQRSLTIVLFLFQFRFVFFW